MKKFQECMGSNSNDMAVVGKCCGSYPTVSGCSEYGMICETFYNGTLPKMDSKTEKEGTKLCDAYCSALSTSTSWRPGLSGGAIAGIVIACVVVVGGAVGAVIFFVFIKKPGGDEAAAA
jgi:hypothetical protein